MDKFKKFIPYLLILLLVGWFSYKFFVERKTPKEQSMQLDWDQLDANSGSKAEKEPVTIKTQIVDGPNGREQKVREFTNSTPQDDEQFAAFDEMEKKWLADVHAIVGDQFYPTYFEMRERNEKEKMQAYKEYHDYLRKKHGDNFTYNISEDQSIREKEINKRYLQELMKLIGEEKFKAYIKARDKINEDNRRNKKEFLQVEF